jgi:hypothetical protein
MTFQLNGAQPKKPAHFAPIWNARFFTGLWTQRNPLRSAGSAYEERYLGTRGDALIDGSNIEITNRLTVARRPGNSVYNSQSFSSVDFLYDFHLFNTTSEQIKVIVDTAAALYDGTGPSTKSLIWTKSAGAGQTIPLGVGNNLYFGNGVDQKKWVQSLTTWIANTFYDINDLETYFIDPNGNLQQLTSTIIPISTIQVGGSNQVIVGTSSATDLTTVLATGLQVKFSGVGTATFLNGVTLTISAVTTSGFTASDPSFGHAAYGPAADTGLATVVQGGNPKTGSVQPTWNVSAFGTTNDNTAQWTNRGNPVENWGIAPPTVAPTVLVGASNVSWQANTFYSNPQVILDTNGGVQQVTTKGKSAGFAPAWQAANAGVGTTTTDGTLVWTKVQTAASLTWAAHTTYAAGSFLIGNAGGTNYLFQLAPITTPYINGTINVFGFNGQTNGAFDKFNPLPAPDFTFTSPSLNWSNAVGQNVQMTQYNGAGEVTGQSDTGHYENWEAAITATIHIRVAGQYSFTLTHDDGAFMAFGDGATRVSGALFDPLGHTQTAKLGFPFLVGQNANASGGTWVITSVWNFPTAGDYRVEIDWCNQSHASQMTLVCNGQVICPSPDESGTKEPIWPTFNTAFAPNYANIQESAKQYKWNNIGPVDPAGVTGDFRWHALTQFLTTANSTIIDPNNNTEAPYEAGVTGSTTPIFATGINQLTNDNPNLIWINQGPAAAPPVGTLSTFSAQGWIYYIALVNTMTDTVSNASPASTQTGPFIGSTGVKVSGGLPATIDPQVDYVAIFRTKDGGATPFLIPGTGNTVFTVPLAEYQANGYTDKTPDSGLNILLQAAVDGENTPPGIGATNLVYHLNRIFFSIGNTVYWTAGPDTPIGNGLEGVPPLNNAVFPSLVTRIQPNALGALVFTVSDIYLIAGNGTATSPLFAYPYAEGIGLLSYNALAVNGTTIGFFSSDSQFIVIEPSGGFGEIGFPIGDLFEANNWNPQNVYVTWHVSGSQDKAWYVADGSTGWFRCNPTAAPETGLTWSPFATITGGVKAVRSIEVSPGVHKLLLGPTGTGQILKRDLSTNADNGTPYTAFFTIGSIVLAQPGQIAELAFITTDSKAIGTRPTVAVLLDEISGAFDQLTKFVSDPPDLPASVTTYAQRFWFFDDATQSPALCRHMQMKFSWPAENFPNEMLSLTLYGGYQQEK